MPTVFWHVWDAPLITIGGGSYLSELVAIAGGKNVFDDLADPSPQVTMEEVVRRDPDYVIVGAVSAERLTANAAWNVVRAVRERRILVADTALVGRPGVRMGEAARHLRSLLEPAVPR
ncbi:MAG: ABC transporter substrate-binding protein [Gemmatimonadetes bacterium]|nr:ABC transporter substrate-binding protein [Gemmatimonadota bacterium]